MVFQLNIFMTESKHTFQVDNFSHLFHGVPVDLTILYVWTFKNTCYIILTHLHLASLKSGIGKQYRPDQTPLSEASDQGHKNFY